MIDFVSTSAGVEPQARGSARLLAAVIAKAIVDAAEPFSKNEKKRRRNLNSEARQAIHFLFARNTVFPLYASLIGSSAKAIRVAVMNPHSTITYKNSGLSFDAGSTRQIRQRLRLNDIVLDGNQVEISDEQE